jgi:hypothetical protein
MELFVLVYRTSSWCLIVIDRPICPTYELLHVLHCSLYIPHRRNLVNNIGGGDRTWVLETLIYVVVTKTVTIHFKVERTFLYL